MCVGDCSAYFLIAASVYEPRGDFSIAVFRAL